MEWSKRPDFYGLRLFDVALQNNSEPLAESYPGGIESAQNRAGYCISLAYVLAARMEFDQAKDFCVRILDQRRAVARTFHSPVNIDYDLAQIQRYLGEFCLSNSEIEAADWTDAG